MVFLEGRAKVGNLLQSDRGELKLSLDGGTFGHKLGLQSDRGELKSVISRVRADADIALQSDRGELKW